MALPEWITIELRTHLRTRFERLAAVRGASATVVDEALDEVADRLETRSWTGALANAIAGDDSANSRRALAALAERICKRRIADELRRSWRQADLAQRHHAATVQTLDTRPSPDQAVLAREILEVVLEAMEILTPEERELIISAVERDAGLEDERALPMSATERSQLSRARSRLSTAVKQRLDWKP